MAVQGTLWLTKHYLSTLTSIFLKGFHYSSYQVVLMRLGGPRSRSYLPDKFLGYSWESNPGPLGWQYTKQTVQGFSNCCFR